MAVDNDLKKILDDHEKRIAALEDIMKSKPELLKKELSIKEFILSKKPQDDVQRTLIIGYYLEKYRAMTSYNAKDLEDGFREAKERVPENINYKVIKNIKKGLMMEAKEEKDNLKAWHLTGSGERFVENDLKID